MASEIEALPDQAGFVKFASSAAWNFVQFPYYELAPRAGGSAAAALASRTLQSVFSDDPKTRAPRTNNAGSSQLSSTT